MSDTAGGGNQLACQRCGEEKPVEAYESTSSDAQADLCEDCYDEVMDEIAGPPDSINEFTIAGEFGYLRLPGPFEVEKEGTVWDVRTPYDAHVSVRTLPDYEGDAAVLVADCEAVGGGVVTDVFEDTTEELLHVYVDQYAMGGGLDD